MENNGKKLYIVKKYIFANSLAEVIKLDPKTTIDSVWVDDEWKDKNLSKDIGYGK